MRRAGPAHGRQAHSRHRWRAEAAGSTLARVAGLIRFVVFAAVLVALLVFVVVPVLASPVLTQMVRDMGLQADDLEVSIDSFDPALFGGRASKVRVVGDNVALGLATVDEMNLTFGNVAFLERTFQTLSGELRGVTVNAGGVTLRVSSVQVDGPADEARATGHFSAAEAERLVHTAAARAGIRLEAVRFVEGGLRVSLAGIRTGARAYVQGGALVLAPDIGPPMVLLQPVPTDPWRLSEAYVTRTGIVVRGVVDATRLMEHLPLRP